MPVLRYRVAAGLALAWCAACGGSGPYGYARSYEPLREESPYAERATTLSYEDVRRDLDVPPDALVGWFGVVTAVGQGDARGESRVALSLRYHQPRHLCRDQSASSCRVTVSESSSGPFTAILTLRDEDRAGQSRVWVGSLLKVYGQPTGEFDDEGAPVIRGSYYRHWPPNTYVTTASRSAMRR
jgi:hypothetical protein